MLPTDPGPIIKCFEEATAALESATTYDQVFKVCRKIETMASTHVQLFRMLYKESFYDSVEHAALPLTKVLVKVMKSTQDVSKLKIIGRTLTKTAGCKHLDTVDDTLYDPELQLPELTAAFLHTYTWGMNLQLLQCLSPIDYDIFMDYFERGSMAPYSRQSKYFGYTLENVNILHSNNVLKFRKTDVIIVLENWDNIHRDVRPAIQELFKHQLRLFNEKENFDAEKIYDGINREWRSDSFGIIPILSMPWTSKTKFQLLTHIMNLRPGLILNQLNFDPEKFVLGCCEALKYNYLLSVSPSLVKATHNMLTFQYLFKAEILKILLEAPESQVNDLIKYWFSSLSQDFIEKLYEDLMKTGQFDNIPTTSKKFKRLLMIKNAFKRTFKNPDLDLKVQKFACEVQDPEVKIEIFKALISSVHSDPKIETIEVILKFLKSNIGNSDSTFIDHHIMRKLPDFFNLLASKKFRNVEVQRKIFGSIRTEIFEHGLDIGSYEAQAFSLKFLNIILKQYSGTSDGKRLTKSTNLEGNQSFKQFLLNQGIWDVTGSDVSTKLLALINQEEDSDLSDVIVTILVDFFIKTNVAQVESINEFARQNFAKFAKDPDLAKASSAKRFFILKFERALMVEADLRELLLIFDDLKNNFAKIRSQDNIVQSMKEGLHLFNLLNCINYGLKRMNRAVARSKFSSILRVLVPVITNDFLNFINTTDSHISFETLDQNLKTLLGDENLHLKADLTNFIWYTLKSCSEITETLADLAVTSEPDEFSSTLSACVKINFTILTRFCHKGAIESASEALGKITKIVSKEFQNLVVRTNEIGKILHALLVTLNNEIDCGVRFIGDTRSARGLILMSHAIIAGHPPFLKFLIEKLLFVPEELLDFEEAKFCDTIKPIQLHLIAALVKDGSLVEEMLPYYNYLLIAVLKSYRETSDFVFHNGLLQIIGAIVPKISNQKRNLEENDEVATKYEPRAVTVEQFTMRFHFFVTFIRKTFKISTLPQLSNTYIVIVLEILANFESTSRCLDDRTPTIIEMCQTFTELETHRCEKIRLLAGKCKALWYVAFRMKTEDFLNIDDVFGTNPNKIQSATNYIQILIERFENNERFVVKSGAEHSGLDLKSKVREKVELMFEEVKSFPGAKNFYIRYHLLNFLIFLGFKLEDEIVKTLMNDENECDMTGFALWSQRIKELEEKQ